MIAETQTRTPHDDLLKGYLNSGYLLDPFYQFSLGAISPGVYSLDEVALTIPAGYSTRNMARQLGVSPATAKVHRRNLYRKLNISSQATLFLLIMDEDSEAG
ncbi:helix-turn-helix transcriptional regulator [Paraburkholderia phytofirmans]|uniref:response regulator transcription factor n=1 Tax=Paraburkholderia phytofirmans TaxID=261302 RepID=UPI0038BC0E1B